MSLVGTKNAYPKPPTSTSFNQISDRKPSEKSSLSTRQYFIQIYLTPARVDIVTIHAGWYDRLDEITLFYCYMILMGVNYSRLFGVSVH